MKHCSADRSQHASIGTQAVISPQTGTNGSDSEGVSTVLSELEFFEQDQDKNKIKVSEHMKNRHGKSEE